MSLLESVQSALPSGEFEAGAYPASSGICGKIIFTGLDKPIKYMGGSQTDVETFKVILKGGNYGALEQKASSVKQALSGAGFIQIGGLEDVEPKEGETFLQLALSFKSIKN